MRCDEYLHTNLLKRQFQQFHTTIQEEFVSCPNT
jgi:hypothetical protein